MKKIQEKKKSKSRSTLILLLVLVAVVVCALAYGLTHIRVVVNDSDVTGSSATQTAKRIADEYDSTKVTLLDKDGKTTELTGTMKQFGYTIDQDAMVKVIESELEKQSGSLGSRFSHLGSGIHITVTPQRKFDESTFKSFVQGSNFKSPRTSMTEGSITYDDSSKKYVMTKAESGNQVDDATLQSKIKEKLDDVGLKQMTKEAVSITIPEECYQTAEVKTANEKLQEELDALNKYTTSSIVYQFGSQTETLDFSTFHDWISYSDGNVTLDDSKVKSYVQKLASKYNTSHKDRGFVTTSGQTIVIPGTRNDYGYRINQDQEAAQIKKDLAGGTQVKREPIYNSKNSYGNPVYYQRNGVDDLNGNYVEVDLTKQHLWCYKDGKLVVESDIVSGNTSKGRGTITGAFPIAFKVSPYTMSSAENGYVVNVQYWMPFYDGQGLHDASWRSSFGGNIYQTNGSHGCVNLPTNVAATIYNNVSAGEAVILYQS